MKKVFLAILVLISFSASAQWTVINGNQRFAKGLGIPTRDTVFSSNPADSSQIVLRPQDTSLYVKYKGKWKKVGANGTGTQDLQSVLGYGRFDQNGAFNLSLNDNYNGGDENYIFNCYNTDKPEIQAKLNIGIGGSEPHFLFGDNSLQYGIGYVDISPSGISLANKNNASNYANTIKVPVNNNNNFVNTLPIGNGTFVVSINGDTADYTGNINITSNDTTSLSTRINGKADTSTVNLKLNASDTANKWVNNIYRKAGKDSIYFQIGSTEYKIKDSVGNTSGFVPYSGATGNVYLGYNALYANRVYGSVVEAEGGGVVVRDVQGQNIYLTLDTIVNGATTKGRIVIYNNTATTKILGTASATRNINLPDSSGTAALKEYTVNSISREAGKDSIIFYVGSTRYAIKDSIGGANGFVPYTGATGNVDLGSFHLNAQAVKINGTAGNGHIDLKHQSADASATGSSSVLFANSDGDIKWKNDSKFYTTLKTSLNSANRVYTFQDKTHTLADSADVALKVNISDTGTMLSPYLRKVDTTVFQRKSIAAYSFIANKTNAAANGTAQTFKDTSGTYTGSIAWTGTTAPSGTATHTYRWTQIGKMVTLNVQLLYTVAGSSLSQVIFDLPSDCPTPLAPSGISGNSRVLYYGAGNMTSNSQLGANASRAGLIINATSSGYSLIIVAASAGYLSASLTIQYYTN